ncbi:MAG: matrixin family metalloprotease [Acidobacteriota bacterium]|nr:matrixin family metalloprotease [Acidobacteriota bacterium]
MRFSFSTAAYTTQFADEGETIRLHWRSGTIPIALSTSLARQNLNIKADSDVLGAIQRSLETWEKVADIKFEIVLTDKQSVSPSGKIGDGISLITIAQTSENLLLFNGDTEEISARTRIFYNGKGFITEADIILNPYKQFSTDGSIGTFDLEATLTHEVGHLLGLEHSSVLGATMHAYLGKNGIYNLSSFSSRTLAEDDISGIRALYGAKDSDENCCGIIIGKLISANWRAAKNFQVWAEETETGRVIAGVLTNSEGFFRIEGLRDGQYQLYAQDFGERKNLVSAENLGSVDVFDGKTSNLSKKLKTRPKIFDVRFVGFNGQIAELAVPINGGKSYLIYVGGKNLDTENFTVGFNSPNISVTPNTLTKHDYGADLSVLSFEIKVKSETPAGEYSFFIKSKDEETGFIVGGLTVESFINPWNSYFSFGDE